MRCQWSVHDNAAAMNCECMRSRVTALWHINEPRAVSSSLGTSGRGGDESDRGVEDEGFALIYFLVSQFIISLIFSCVPFRSRSLLDHPGIESALRKFVIKSRNSPRSWASLKRADMPMERWYRVSVTSLFIVLKNIIIFLRIIDR